MAGGHDRYVSNSTPTYSLVLSIFKGENFVIKGSGGCRAFLRAKCADLKPELALETGTTKLTSACSDPEFNSQLAWSLSRKQLKELRSNRSTIKVSCITVDERTGSENEVGYVIMHVKDASSFGAGIDVDPTKARLLPLLGTRDIWRSHQPRVQMILHLEDLVTRERENSNPGSEQKAPVSNKQPSVERVVNQTEKMDNPLKEAALRLSETKIQQDKEPDTKFVWSVHETDGYFQLGTPADQDDLYILNTTVISATFLHKLWDGRSPRKGRGEEYFWQIKYSAYGCDIASEPFLLSLEDASRRTFIGDKATARIRASGRLFYEYLRDTSLEFHVIRYNLGPNNEFTNEQVMGFCFLSLLELSQPDKQELKACMEVVSEWGTSKAMSSQEKPEVRAIFALEAVPNFFSLYTEPLENLVDEEAKTNVKPESIPSEKRAPATASNVNNNDGVNVNRRRGRGASQPKSTMIPEELDEDVPDSPAINVEDNSNNSNLRRLLEFEGNHDNFSNSPPETSPRHREASPALRANQKRGVGTQSYATDPDQKLTAEYSSSEEMDSADKENLEKLLPGSGTYDVVIKLKNFWLKSSHLITDTMVLTYHHPPIDILEPIETCARPLSTNFTDVRQEFRLEFTDFSKTVPISEFTKSLLNEPLTVEFCKMVNGKKCKSFATSMVPFGRVFFAQEHSHRQRCLIDGVDILKMNSNAKIGTLFFEIKLIKKSSHVSRSNRTAAQKPSAFFPGPGSEMEKDKNKIDYSPEKFVDGVNQIDAVTNEMREWSKTQKQLYIKQKEEKDAAYAKILSEEAVKRDAERERLMSKKWTEIEKKEKEINKQRHQMNEREQKLNKLELEVHDKFRELSMQNENIQQSADFKIRSMEESHKISLDILHRKIQNYQEDNEKLKTKVVLLEKKIEVKNTEIDNLIDLKREHPDARLASKVYSLEEENKTLKNQLREATVRKEQYKKQSMALGQKLGELYEKRDQDLLDLNENLRLQILATKEHKELKKERKTVTDLSDKLRALKKERVPHRDGKGDQLDEHPVSAVERKSGDQVIKDDEIRRLQAERNRLLQTGAYTQFDLVIKELENKMILLSQTH